MTVRSPLAALVSRILPHASAARLSRKTGVRLRGVHYWLTGENDPPAEITDWIDGQNQAVERFPLAARLDVLIEEAKKAGIDDEVIASWLALAHESLVKRPPE
jgi:hypothetical protein